MLVCLKTEANSDKPNYRIRKILAIIYILFTGLRGANVGVDTPIYYRHYYTYGELGCIFVEPGFDWINRFCYHQGWESWTLFLICTSLTILPVYFMLNTLNRKEYTISALLFYGTTFVTISNGMRQAVVCGVFLYLMSFFFNKNRLNKKELSVYIGGILISTLMHVTAIFLLPLLFLSKLHIKRNIYVILYALSFAFCFLNIGSYIPYISIGERDYERYAFGNAVVKQASLLGFTVSSCLRIIIVYIMYKTNSFKRYRVLSHLVMLAFFLSNLGFNVPIIGRVTMYFSWFVFIIIAKMFSDYRLMNKRSIAIEWLAIATIYIVLTVYSIISPTNRILPYTIYWENNNYEKYIDFGL